MKPCHVVFATLAIFCLMTFSVVVQAEEAQAPAEKSLAGLHGVKLTVKAQGPYDADVPLQVVCFFKHKAAGDVTKGAPVELDKRLGGVITSLRNRGEFVGDELETLLLTSPAGTIKPTQLLLIGLGEETSLDLATLERIGRLALRQAAAVGAKKVAFAPLLRDQGNDTLSIGDVETAVVRGMLLAYDTDKRLQAEGLAAKYQLEEWIVEAGPAFFDETITGVQKAVDETTAEVAKKPVTKYATSGK